MLDDRGAEGARPRGVG